VAELTPKSRHNSGTGKPDSTRLIASMIWLSVNLDRFMQNFFTRKFYF
jgi:hypothetical protein